MGRNYPWIAGCFIAIAVEITSRMHAQRASTGTKQLLDWELIYDRQDDDLPRDLSSQREVPAINYTSGTDALDGQLKTENRLIVKPGDIMLFGEVSGYQNGATPATPLMPLISQWRLPIRKVDIQYGKLDSIEMQFLGRAIAANVGNFQGNGVVAKIQPSTVANSTFSDWLATNDAVVWNTMLDVNGGRFSVSIKSPGATRASRVASHYAFTLHSTERNHWCRLVTTPKRQLGLVFFAEWTDSG